MVEEGNVEKEAKQREKIQKLRESALSSPGQLSLLAAE